MNRLRLIARGIPSLRKLAAQIKAAFGPRASLHSEPSRKTLRRTTPDEIAWTITAPLWVNYVQSYASLLQNFTVGTVPQAVELAPQFADWIRESKGKRLNREQRNKYVTDLLALALGVALLKDGWQLPARTAQPYLARGAQRIEPFSTVARLASNKLSPEDWVARCHTLGIATLPLADRGKESPPTPSSIA